MSTSNGTGASRRLRTAGLALLGLAVIAVLIGIVLAVTREGPTSATGPAASGPSATGSPPVTGPPPGTPTGVPGSASPAPSAVFPFPSPASSPPAQAPEVAAPGPPEEAAGDPGGDAGRDKGLSRGAVRVFNNSTVHGLAAQAARDFTAAGWTVVEVGNYAQGTIPTTTAYYQEGTDQRTDAEVIGEHFRMRVEPRFPGIANASPGLIVIVTRDYVSP